MAFIRAQVRWRNDTAAAADDAVNTFHWATNNVGTLAQESSDIVGLLATWVVAVDGLLSENLVTPATITTYDLEDPMPRSPIESTDVAITPGAGSQPNQLAIIARYKCDNVSGVPRARLRGRHYLGPLSATWTDSTGDVVLSSTTINAVGNAYQPLFPPSVGVASGSTLAWSLFSRATYNDTAGSEAVKLAAAFDTVTSVIIPSRLGTQRRRVVRNTATTVFT